MHDLYATKRTRRRRRGKYADLTIVAIGQMIGRSRWSTRRHLRRWYSREKYAGREDDPAALAAFLRAWFIKFQPAIRMAELESENARLRKRVQDLEIVNSIRKSLSQTFLG